MAELVCRASDPGWLEARRSGVTATDIVTLAGLASWDSPFALYWRKKGRLPEVEQTARMRLGIWLEERIALEWLANSGCSGFTPGGLYRNSDRAWQLATPDYMAGERRAVLEVKTASSRDGWGDDGTADVPGRVRAQVLWQMDVMGVDTGHVAVCFLPSGEIRSYTISHDQAHIRRPDLTILDEYTCSICDEIDGLRDVGFGFWSRLLTDRPPAVDGLPATTEALKSLHGWEPKTEAEIDRDIAQAYEYYKAELAADEREVKRLENRIRDAMGDAAFATWNGRRFARREVYKRREYTVPAGMVDRLVRVKPKETGDA